jgi:hypothetical protein
MDVSSSTSPLALPAALTLREVEEVLLGHPSAAGWLASLRTGPPRGRTLTRRAYAASARQLSGERAAVAGPGLPHWSWLDWGRLWVLVQSLESDAEPVALVRALFEHGELGEQQSVLRTLAYLPDAARFAVVGEEGCRTNATDVFEALALDNPFPAAVFGALAFNQMAIKAVFLGVPVGRVWGLRERHTPELSRMAAALASERRAAGRDVPDDLSLLIQHGEPK